MAIMTIGNFYIIFAGCIASLIVLWTKPLHINHTAKGHTSLARQSSHCLPTPRIGGLIIILGYSVGVCFLPKSDATSIATLLGLSALPVFLGGFGEDTGFNISTRLRLILSFVSAMIAGLLFNSWIPSLGISGLAFVTDYAIPAVLLTVIISAGISHAFNLIDGLNGLAMGIALIVDIGLGSLAYLVGDIAIASICSILAASLVGILIFNFPLGKIFLGDAGAYSVGHILVWIAILMLNRNSDIAPFAILLMFFWPIADMLFSIYRRYRGGRPIDQPDRLHFHQMVMRALELTFLAKKTRELTNPLATLVILPLAAAPVILSYFVRSNNTQALIACFICTGLFLASYWGGLMLAKRFARTGSRKARGFAFGHSLADLVAPSISKRESRF
mgnify:FL=1